MRLGFGLDIEGGVTFALAEGTGRAQLREQHVQRTEMGSKMKSYSALNREPPGFPLHPAEHFTAQRRS